MAQFQILAYAGTAQIEVTILHTDIVTTIRIVFDGKGRCQALAQHIQLVSQNLDVACRHLRVLRLALADNTLYLYTPLTTQTISLFAQGSIL